MYAVIKAGGKQHRVKPGDVIEVELMHSKDDEVEFRPLLVVDDDNKTHVGSQVAKAVVTGKLLGEQKGEKVRVFKYRNKTGYARHQGHRQMHTLVEIGEIRLPGQKAAAAKKPAEAKADSDGDRAASKPKSSAKSTAKSAATKTAEAKTAAAAEPAAANDEDAASDAAPAETPPAEVAEVAAKAETGPDAAGSGESETEAEAEAEAGE